MTFPEWLTQRLKQTLPGRAAQVKMRPLETTDRFAIPDKARESSVLLLLYPDLSDYSLIAIQRSRDGGVHSGQIAFPGGKIETFDPSPEAAALREAREEIHLNSRGVTLLGRLTPLYIPVSHFKIIPVVGFQSGLPSGLYPSEAEVDQILTLSLNRDLPNKRAAQTFPTFNNTSIQAPCYVVNQKHLLWGASAMILSELEALWKEYHR